MNNIRKLRKEKNLTQKELAKILNVSDRSVGFYETGERDPDTETLNKLANFFNVSIDYLLGRTEIKKSTNKEDMANQLIQVLIDAGELEPGEELTDEKRERLFKMVKKAIELSKL